VARATPTRQTGSVADNSEVSDEPVAKTPYCALCRSTKYPPDVTRGKPTMSMPAGSPGLIPWLQNCTANAGKSGHRGGGKVASIGEIWAADLIGYSLGNLLVPNSMDSARPARRRNIGWHKPSV
jgi:hypothetical protein